MVRHRAEGVLAERLATGAAQLLASVESFVGALLMALLVFVLGRRTTW